MFEWMDRSFRIWIGFPRIKNTTNICNEISSGWKTYYETLVMQPSYVMFCLQPIHSNHFKKDLRSCSCILCAMSPFLVTAPKPVNRKQKNFYSHSLHNGSIHVACCWARPVKLFCLPQIRSKSKTWLTGQLTYQLTDSVIYRVACTSTNANYEHRQILTAESSQASPS